MTALTHEVATDDLDVVVAEECLPRLRHALANAGPHHRMRVADLPPGVMRRLAMALHEDARWVVRLLVVSTPAEPYEATATKLIEMRNDEARPVLVFLPTGLRVAAEDSLDVATFQDVNLRDVGQALVERLYADLHREVEQRAGAEAALAFLASLRTVARYLGEERVITDDDAWPRYLLTVLRNGATPEAAGAALFVFGLVPDPGLFARGGHQLQWLTRNRKAAKELADHRHALQERIGRIRLEAGTIQARLFAYLRPRLVEGRRDWGRDIAWTAEWADLSFDHWPFIDRPTTQDIRLILDPLGLPRQAHDAVGDAVQMPVLDLSRNSEMKVSFRAIPAPAEAEQWKTYRIQIFAVNAGESTRLWESPNYAKAKKAAKSSRTIKAGDLRDQLPEGTYFLRVEAFSEDDAILTRPQPVDPRDPTSRPENESARFLVVHSDTPIEPTDEPRAVFVDSLLGAYFALRGSSLLARGKHREYPPRADLTGTWDVHERSAGRAEVRFAINDDNAAGRTVRMPGLVWKVEMALLADPTYLHGYLLDLSDGQDLADAALQPVRQGTTSQPGVDLEAFLDARTRVFEAIRDQHKQRNPTADRSHVAGVVEVADLLAIEPAIRAYAKAFADAVAAALQKPAGALRAAFVAALTRLDRVEVRWPKAHSDPGRGVLLGPTHPVRLLWHLQHARYREQVLDALSDGIETVPDLSDFLSALESAFVPTHLPTVLFKASGRPYVEQDLLTPFWSLYLPADRPDRAVDVSQARSNARKALGIRRGGPRIGEVASLALGADILDYLRRHPYVQQLRINVFNPGDGERVASLLRDVERRRRELRDQGPPDLRYAVHLFASAEHIDRAGEAIDALLDPDRQVADDDEFTVGSGNHLRPKLLISRSTHDEFLRDPTAFPAHVTLLVEQFRVDGRIADVGRFARGSFVRGLLLEAETLIDAPGGSFGWMRGVHAVAQPDADEVETALVEGVSLVQRLQAADAGAEGPGATGPAVALRLEPRDQALLRAIHDVSDLVMTIDRNLGLDYFDSPTVGREVGYLLDFSPEFIQGDAERVLLTTRCTEELLALVHPALSEAGLDCADGTAEATLETLRSLSGRLALRLFGGTTATREVVGLLLARWMLQTAHLLDDRIVIPVDAHQHWFTDSDGVPQSRADILLISVDPDARALDVSIVEVKLRKTLAPEDRLALYRGMHEQAASTERLLRQRFDPDRLALPRADRLLRAKELFSLLNFYAGRAVRYKLLSREHEARIRGFLDTLDQGYTLLVRSRGVVYAEDTVGNHTDEDLGDFPVHRFGVDTAQRLLDAAVRARTAPSTDPGDNDGGPEGGGDAEAPLPVAAIDSLRTLFDAPRLAPIAAARPWSEVLDSASVWHAEATDEHEPPGSGPHPGTNDQEVAEPQQAREPTAEVQPAEQVGPTTPPAAQPPRAPAPSTTAGTPPVVSPAQPAPGAPQVDVVLGVTEVSAQYGLLGRMGQARVAIDLTGCNTVSLFGVQGFGKSYTLGVIAEMGSQPLPGINALTTPLATVLFHYHKSDAYPPEYADAVEPNNKQREIDRLLAEYSARPAGLRDVVLLSPEAKVEQRRAEFPGVEVRPIKFSSAEIGPDGWKFLMGAVGNDSLYVRQMIEIMQSYGNDLTLAALEKEVAEADFPKAAERLAQNRLRLARRFIDDSSRIRDLLRPGRTIIVDMRDEWLERDQALGLFLILMGTFAQAKLNGRLFNKLMVFDEAHKYITESDLIGEVVSMIREMRHWAASVVIASQDPLSVPRAVIELTSILVLHRMTSPHWLKHLKTAISALETVGEAHVASLAPGEALVWAQRATDQRFTQRPQKVVIRPRVTRHGGGTRAAVEGATVR